MSVQIVPDDDQTRKRVGWAVQNSWSVPSETGVFEVGDNDILSGEIKITEGICGRNDSTIWAGVLPNVGTYYSTTLRYQKRTHRVDAHLIEFDALQVDDLGLMENTVALNRIPYGTATDTLYPSKDETGETMIRLTPTIDNRRGTSRSHVLWALEKEGGWIEDRGTFGDNGVKSITVTLPQHETEQRYTLKAGMDHNLNGTLDPGEDDFRVILVAQVPENRFDIIVDLNRDGVVDAHDTAGSKDAALEAAKHPGDFLKGQSRLVRLWSKDGGNMILLAYAGDKDPPIHMFVTPAGGVRTEVTASSGKDGTRHFAIYDFTAAPGETTVLHVEIVPQETVDYTTDDWDAEDLHKAYGGLYLCEKGQSGFDEIRFQCGWKVLVTRSKAESKNHIALIGVVLDQAANACKGAAGRKIGIMSVTADKRPDLKSLMDHFSSLKYRAWIHGGHGSAGTPGALWLYPRPGTKETDKLVPEAIDDNMQVEFALIASCLSAKGGEDGAVGMADRLKAKLYVGCSFKIGKGDAEQLMKQWVVLADGGRTAEQIRREIGDVVPNLKKPENGPEKLVFFGKDKKQAVCEAYVLDTAWP